MISLPKNLTQLSLPKGLGGRHPERDWLIILACALLALAISVWWNTSFFLRVLSGEAASATPTHITTAGVEGLQDAFRAQLEEGARYSTEYQFVDPSR
ncbi:MAG TPA: hypothetical protein VEB18_00855 [Candidatus Paceibacterota bacterium]|nr:hypothetical protein [Candidatus Paceibacterota bacterium]